MYKAKIKVIVFRDKKVYEHTCHIEEKSVRAEPKFWPVLDFIILVYRHALKDDHNQVRLQEGGDSTGLTEWVLGHARFLAEVVVDLIT